MIYFGKSHIRPMISLNYMADTLNRVASWLLWPRDRNAQRGAHFGKIALNCERRMASVDLRWRVVSLIHVYDFQLST